MGIRITDTTMTLTGPTGATTATAHLRDGAWTVTGYPGRRFTRDQAITALTLTEVLTTNPPPGNRMWLHIINDWRAELDLPPLTPTDHPTRDAAPLPPRTVAAPRNPARTITHEHEVTPS